ncbi:MAG TPA: hypothetical protein PK014_00975 [Thermoanaerobaculia bacterium]|nr:hypothetical protein [Thermoanaerobaculia bacterium]HUM29742.1 hypothetical protein [Thermoanaerobaculia bacterium]HXK67042.1 hypothetical protein [Thermoanaerobaculia bacterium]
MEKNTPDWLIEAQNKSWEPEILISGITLTFVFLLSGYVYNFFGMLIQEHGVFDAASRLVFIVATFLITGLKITLVIHLILRGVWTAFVGLSFVYPHGVKRENLNPSNAGMEFPSLDTYVIQLEKVCSLLFSFIFTSVVLFIGVFIVEIPVILFAFLGLDRAGMRVATLVYVGLVVFVGSTVGILLETKWKDSKVKRWIESSIFQITLVIYITNIGIRKAGMLFLSYFAIILLIAMPEIRSFSFANDKPVSINNTLPIVTLDPNHYENQRNPTVRIQRAAIDEFQVEGSTLNLFLSFYKNDNYNLGILKHNTEARKTFEITKDVKHLIPPDLFQIDIDDLPLHPSQWYRTEHPLTHQTGWITEIDVSMLEPGPHMLTINKIVYKLGRKKFLLVEPWDLIPFEVTKFEKN